MGTIVEHTRMTPSRWARVKSLFVKAQASSLLVDDDLTKGPTVEELLRLLRFRNESSERHAPTGARHEQAAAAEPGSNFQPGALIADRFEIKCLIGSGGMGDVYEAHDIVKDVTVALKVLRPELSVDPQTAESLLRKEVSLAQLVSHPNVCRIHDPYLHRFPGGETRLLLSMELLRGQTLAQLLTARGRLTTDETLIIARQLAAGIEAAHAAGVFHRDLKPSNVMLVEEGGQLRVVITDFGLARSQPAAQSVEELSRGLAGTLRYMAPEQLEGKGGFRSDLYAFALILFELVTGELPFQGESDLVIALSRLSAPPRDPGTLVPRLPLAWRAAFLKGLSRDPRERFGKASDMIAALAPGRRASLLLWLQVLARRRHRPARLVWLLLLPIVLTALVLLLLQLRSASMPGFSSVLVQDLEHGSTVDKGVLGANVAFFSSLSQSPHLTVFRPADFAPTLTKMGATPGHLSVSSLRQLALRTGVPAILYGSISQARGEYKLHLRMEVMSDSPRHPMAAESRDFKGRDQTELFDAIAAASRWVRKVSGEGPRELREQDARPEDLTTFSWDALSLFEQARSRRDANQPQEALIFASEALEADDGFAAAESLRGDLLAQLRRYREAFAAHARALELAKKRNITGRERFRIESILDVDTGDENASVQTYRAWMAHFPRDYLPHFFMAYLQYHRGNYAEALAQIKVARQLQPSGFLIYPHLATYAMAAGQWADAQAAANSLKKLGEEDWATEVEGQMLLGQHHFDAAAAHVEPLIARHDDVFSEVAPWYVAHALADGGRFPDAENILSRAAETDEQRGLSALRAERIVTLCYLRWLQGDTGGAAAQVRAVLGSLDNPTALSIAGAVLARLGDSGGARTAESLLEQWPAVPLVTSALSRVRTEIRLSKGLRPLPPVDEESAAAVDLEFCLHFSLATKHWDAMSHLAAEITRRPDVLLSWDNRPFPPALYWTASCIAEKDRSRGKCGAFTFPANK